MRKAINCDVEDRNLFNIFKGMLATKGMTIKEIINNFIRDCVDNGIPKKYIKEER